ncbi:hypothetical protein J6590_094679 [Homalodisca vitripennis]|nr:hypothetical protein J6590_094679 [Homalodisca vitripennis]
MVLELRKPRDCRRLREGVSWSRSTLCLLYVSYLPLRAYPLMYTMEEPPQEQNDVTSLSYINIAIWRDHKPRTLARTAVCVVKMEVTPTEPGKPYRINYITSRPDNRLSPESHLTIR